MSLVVNVSLKIHHVIFNNEPSKFILTPYYLIRVVLQFFFNKRKSTKNLESNNLRKTQRSIDIIKKIQGLWELRVNTSVTWYKCCDITLTQKLKPVTSVMLTIFSYHNYPKYNSTKSTTTYNLIFQQENASE